MNMTRRTLLVGGASLAAATSPAWSLAAPTTIKVYKDPNCGCCHLWAEAMTKAGYDVQLIDLEDLAPVKARHGITEALQACHTAEVEGYFLEGHVPLSSVRRLLAERPEIKGLAVAGMPSGSLGMGNDPAASYDVIAVPRTAAPYLFEAIRPKT